MSDPNFHRTVVLIIEHTQDGAFGLIVNRRSNLALADILTEFQTDTGQETAVYVGGPVQQEFLFAIHSSIPESITASSIQVVDDVIFEPAFRNIDQYFREEYLETLQPNDQPKIHLYLGYSGWGPGQLEKEINDGSWMTVKATSKIVFHPNPEEGWQVALRQKGGIYKVFADTNPDPNLN